MLIALFNVDTSPVSSWSAYRELYPEQSLFPIARILIDDSRGRSPRRTCGAQEAAYLLDFPSGLNENPRPPEQTESPAIPDRYPSPVAQLVERLTVNQLVAGSSPARGAIILEKALIRGPIFF